MTVAAISPSAEYIEDGVTTAFPAPFRFLSAAHLVVDRLAADGSIATLAAGSGFTATGGTTDAGGTVTVSAPAVAGTILRIKRETPRSQIADYATGDTFPAETHEAALDRSMLLHQEQDAARARLEHRALRVPDGETVSEVPAQQGRIDRLFYWDAYGQPQALPFSAFVTTPAPAGTFDGGYHGIAGSGDTYDGGYNGLA